MLDAMETLGAAAPRAAAIFPGEALKSPWQWGYAVEVAQICQRRRMREPYGLAIGSSFGSPLAAMMGGGARCGHEAVEAAWLRFREDLSVTRFAERSRLSDFSRPVQDAFVRLLDRSDLIDWDAAYDSPTNVVVVVTQVDVNGAGRELGEIWDAQADNVRALLEGKSTNFRSVAVGLGRILRALQPRYYGTAEWSAGTAPENYQTLANADELRRVVMASTRLPSITGGEPIYFEGRSLIDGAWSDNVPVPLALDWGAELIHVVDCCRGGKLYQKPILTYLQKQLGEVLDIAEGVTSVIVERIAPSGEERYAPPQLLDSVIPSLFASAGRLVSTLRERVEKPGSLDLAELREAHPSVEIWHDHLPASFPDTPRFLPLPAPNVLTSLYRTGIDSARERFAEDS
ncbi:MAG: patatin-like phospholipase family protein [Polyangiaceae bacterium]|nr:patatin-like phospholipase family protein [Polyangiaceae bacterium]